MHGSLAAHKKNRQKKIKILQLQRKKQNRKFDWLPTFKAIQSQMPFHTTVHLTQTLSDLSVITIIHMGLLKHSVSFYRMRTWEFIYEESEMYPQQLFPSSGKNTYMMVMLPRFHVCLCRIYYSSYSVISAKYYCLCNNLVKSDLKKDTRTYTQSITVDH